MSSLANKSSIFESYTGQNLNDIDPADIRPLEDRVLIREIPEEEMRGNLFIPEVARDKQRIRIGIVVAVGLGDRFSEKIQKGQSTTSDGRPVVFKKALAERAPMEVKVGDKVYYDRRKEAEYYFGGVLHGLVHEEQSILAIIEPDAAPV